LLAVLASCARGQESVGQTPPDNLGAERARIDAVRQQKTVELDAEDAACFSKFAVSDCQSRVGTRRRQMLADLKRQEAKLNAAERRQKGEEQSRTSQDKTAEGAQHEREVQAGIEKATQAERQKNQDDKVVNHQNQAKPSKPHGTKSTSALDAATVEKNRAAYQDKLKQLEKRRQERDKRLKDQGTGAPPLPTAP
jgi:hypothetical protein